MKVKEIDRTANSCWSPDFLYPIYLATGTAGQQLDSSFSTSAALEVYCLNLNDPGNDLQLIASLPSEERFYKLIWGSGGNNGGNLVGGCDHGTIQIYNASKLLNKENGLTLKNQKHSGPVRALDFNAFQTNLLGSGASASEIFIWDLNNPTTPMTPGANSQPPEDVVSLAWNKQVQHILATTFSSKCVFWDLRKNDPIIKLTDGTCRLRWSDVAWNPDVATQLCLASEDDQTPFVQLWDLRFATSPVKVLEGHQKGVLSISWSQQDSEMLLSCGKDNRILCWNPNATYPGGELICEMSSGNQWNFSVSWCPRHPALFSCCSFDGHVSVYSVLGAPQQQQTSTKIADSFPGMELYAQAPVSQVQSTPVDLRKPPKWLKRPAVAKFGFGGKLTMAQQRSVTICQVTTEPGLVARANLLEGALRNATYEEFCRGKVATSANDHKRMLWQFLAASFSPNPREEYLDLLGFHSNELTQKISQLSLNKRSVSDRLTTLGRSTDSDSEYEANGDFSEHNMFLQGPDGESTTKEEFSFNDSFNLPASDPPIKKSMGRSYKISTSEDIDGLICEALLLGNTEVAVEICIQDERWADAIILAMSGGADLLAKTQHRYLQENSDCLAKLISAVVTEDWTPVIENCDVSSWREALVAALTHSNDQFPHLCEVLGDRLNAKNAQLCFLCAGNLQKLVSACLSESTNLNSEEIQDLVEVIMLLRAAMQQRGRAVDLTGSAGNLLSQYAQILASEGNLEMALSYLETSQDEQVQQLKARVYHSIGLGRQSAPQYKQQQPHQQQQQQQHQPTANYQSSFSNQIAPKSQSMIASSFQPSQNSIYSPTAAPIPTSSPLQRNQMVNDTISHPPPSGGIIPPRSKHVADPSMGPLPGTVPTVPYNPNLQPYPSNPVQPPFPQTPNTFPNQAVNYGPVGNIPPAGGQVPPIQTQPQLQPQPPGWNDPPPLTSATRKQDTEISAYHAGTKKWQQIIGHSQVKQTDYVPAPIMQPLYNPANQPGQVPSASNGLYDPYSGQNQSNRFSGMPPPPPPTQTYNPNQSQSNIFSPTPPPSNVPPSNYHPPADFHQAQTHPAAAAAPPPPPPVGQSVPPPLSFPYGAPVPKATPPVSQNFQKFPEPQTTPAPPPNFGQTSLPPSSVMQNQFQPIQNAPPPLQPNRPPSVTSSQRPPSQNQLPPQLAYPPPPSGAPLQQGFKPTSAVNNGNVPTIPPYGSQQNLPPPPPPPNNNIPVQNYPSAPNNANVTAQPEKPRRPIPEEHIHLQTVLDELRNRCIQAATNPQLKRKLDDVARKLDCLYEALADGRLSKRTLDSLHDISQRVQSGDYTGGLQVHTQLVSGPDFAQIAPFMPGIKILLQCALQLQVYL